MDSKFVYHGSHEPFHAVVPKRQRRYGPMKDGISPLIFDDISFHATPHRWIALAYTAQRKMILEVDAIKLHYRMGVDLYQEDFKVMVFGAKSLEHTLKVLYGKGGFLYSYKKEHFFHTKGLGSLEVITQKQITPVASERIQSPVDAMKKCGVEFEFMDLLLPENARFRV